MSIRSWSTTAASNNSNPPNGWPEGMAPSAVNNSARQMMADIRDAFEALPWFDYGHSPTRVDDDTITIAADLTALYTSGRRVKLVGATTGYGTVTTSSYSAPDTTINIAMDSGTVPASLSTVSLGTNSDFNPGDIRLYGAIGDGTTDCTSAFEAAFAQLLAGGRPVYVPAGTYIVSSSLLYELPDPNTAQQPGLIMYGDGMYRSIIKSSVASDAALHVRTTDVDQPVFQNGVYLADLSIIPEGTPASQHGVRLSGIYGGRMERVRIAGFTGHGIYMPNLDATFTGGPDYYGVVNFEVWNCQISENDGHGIWSEMGAAFIPSIRDSGINVNAEGGIYMAGGGAGEIMGCSISYNGTDGNGYGGLTLARSSGSFAAGAQTLHVERVEFDRNRNYHINVGALTCGLFELNRFIGADEGATTAHVPPIHVSFDLVASGTAGHITFRNNFHRRTDSTYAVTTYDLGSDANVSHIELINNRWASTSNTTKYANIHASSRVQIEDTGEIARTNLSGSFARGRITSGTPVVTGSAADVVWSSETTDINSALNTTTGIYVCPATGVYSIDVALTISGLGAGDIVTLKLIQDTGSDFTACEMQFCAGGINHETFPLTRKIFLNEGDELRIQALQDSGSNKNIRVGDPYNWFCVSLDAK